MRNADEVQSRQTILDAVWGAPFVGDPNTLNVYMGYLRKKVEAKGKYFTIEVYCTYNSIRLLADAFERAGTTDPHAVNAALATSTLDPLMMPYGPTKMVNGQNMGSRAVSIQAQNVGVKVDALVVYPNEFASAKAFFPRPA